MCFLIYVNIDYSLLSVPYLLYEILNNYSQHFNSRTFYEIKLKLNIFDWLKKCQILYIMALKKGQILNKMALKKGQILNKMALKKAKFLIKWL